jgi:hypothetical protein
MPKIIQRTLLLLLDAHDGLSIGSPSPESTPVVVYVPAESKSDSLERFPGSGVTPSYQPRLNRFHRQKNGLGGDLTLCN